MMTTGTLVKVGNNGLGENRVIVVVIATVVTKVDELLLLLL